MVITLTFISTKKLKCTLKIHTFYKYLNNTYILVIVMPPQMLFDPLRFTTELIYTVSLVLACFLIYFKTRESYELTKYKGIMFFRDAFLFLGLSYLMRFILFIMRFTTIEGPGEPRLEIFPIILLLTGYLSTMGIAYLLFSSIWKKIDSKYIIVTTHILALVLSVVSFITRSQDVLAILQLIMLIITTFIIFISKNEHKKLSQTKILYGLILLFWIMDLWILVPRGIFSFEVKIIFQILSLIVFIIMYLKVTKWAK